jgi:hypothetical protein
VAQVARYLAHQEAIDLRVRIAPPLDDPRWNGIQAGPDGQLYDLAAGSRLVKKLLEAMKLDQRRVAVPGWWWGRAQQHAEADPQLAPLRLFCRLRGIELPYRTIPEHGARTRGLAQAVEHVVAAGRPDAVILLSDLAGLAEDAPALTRALARARRVAGSVVALVPDPAAFLPAASSELGARVRALAVRDARAQAELARRLLARAGVRIVDVGPSDVPSRLLGRGQRGPGGQTRRAA